MTRVGVDDTVVYEVALNDHPLAVGEDDDRTDEELIADVAERTETADGLDWPDWMVAVSEPPDDDMERIRYVTTTSRINVRVDFSDVEVDHDINVFEEIEDRLDIEDYPGHDEKPAMSHWGATHEDDFQGDVHLDLADGNE